MKFIPSRNFTIYSCLSFNEVKEILNNQYTKSVFDKRYSPFVSTTGEDYFIIHKALKQKFNFRSITVGTKDSTDDHIIHIEQKLHPIFLATFFIECLIGFALLITAIILTFLMPQTLYMDLMLVPLSGLCVLASYMGQRLFNRQTDLTRKELLKLINGVQVHKELTPLTAESLIF